MTQSQLHHLLVISDKVSSWPMFPVIMDNNKMPCPSPEVPLACVTHVTWYRSVYIQVGKNGRRSVVGSYVMFGREDNHSLK